MIQKVRQRYDFVSQKLAENKIPNGPQLADFVRKLVADLWAVAPAHTKQLLRPDSADRLECRPTARLQSRRQPSRL